MMNTKCTELYAYKQENFEKPICFNQADILRNRSYYWKKNRMLSSKSFNRKRLKKKKKERRRIFASFYLLLFL